MKALIVDDERLARLELTRLLAENGKVEVVAEAENGDQALALLATHKPDVIFMDVQMPGKNGFETLMAMHEPRPAIIFTTAYDEFALKAFEFSAVDYLLKPIDPERLEHAIEKINSPQNHSEADDDDEGLQTAIPFRKTLGPEDQVFIKDGDKCFFIRLGQVKYFESVGNYVQLHYEGGRPMILRSLNALEERLDENSFFRASRKHIVNLKRVEAVEPYFSGGLLLKMQGGDKIEVSRRQASRFKDLLSL